MPRFFGQAAVLILLFGTVLLGLPMLGVMLAGKPIPLYLEFPPQTQYVAHAPFSTAFFIAFSTLGLAMVTGLVFLVFPRRRVRAHTTHPPFSFPWWGWPALLLLGAAWILAWSRFSWFHTLQPFTFTPLWVGYIILINALTFRRVGGCLLTKAPRYFVLLFPVSSVFWWYFEYLNRFVQNWFYQGVESFGPGLYAVHASVAFSTVLPAVVSTAEWLGTHPWLQTGYSKPVSLTPPRAYGWVVLAMTALTLFGVGIWPNYLFPLLWVSPLIAIASVQVALGGETYFSGLSAGEWHRIYIPALAALQCGVCWELWNYFSYAKWVYTVPFVDRFDIFEMPLLGYSGYLPFGLVCMVVAGLIRRSSTA